MTTKTLSVVAVMAILFGGFVPNIAFAQTVQEEAELDKYITIDLTRSASRGDVSAAVGDVSLELALLADISGSVDNTEFVLQRTGYSDAFRDPEVVNKIVGCNGNCIAVQLVYWSSFDRQVVAVDWTIICNQEDADAFADAIDAAGRPFGGSTSPGDAINFAVGSIFENEISSDRQVIDVSGDGVENQSPAPGADTSNARDAALVAGIDAINGIYIQPTAPLIAFYTNDIKGGVGSFVLGADSFDDFTPAIEEKLLAESCPEDPVVGGESLDINMTSLFVTGIFGNALWIAPVAAGIAGTGLYLARSKIK